MQLINYSLELAQPKESDRLSRHESGAVGKRLARRVLHRRFDVVDFGISKASATGDVYNLTDSAK